jgi:hypothetical protein
MAFSSTVTNKTVFGNKRVHYGTWDGSGVTTGNINTGLRLVEHISLTAKKSAVTANTPVVNEVFPCAGSAVTVVFDSGLDGYWMATGC